MTKKKQQILQNVTVTGVAAEGKSIARHDDKVIFIDHAAPGDVVDLKITKSKRSFSNAVPVKFHHYSPERVTPLCQHFGTCGGCKWQHLDYQHQLKYKAQQVIDTLERIGKVTLPPVSPILGSAETSFYRNKLEYTFSAKRWLTQEEVDSDKEISREGLGFHIPGRFDKILDIEKCWLQQEPSNKIRNELRQYALDHNISFFDLVRQEGYLRILIIRTSNTNEVMVILQVAEDKPELLIPILEHLKLKFPEITSLNYVINTKKNETFHDLEVVCYHGSPYISEKMEELQFRVGPKSFFQTNSNQAYELYKIVRDFAGLTGKEKVYDLYTGTGTIALFLAKQAAQVTGVEYVEMAVEDAKKNAIVNNIDNVSFYAGDMKDILVPEFIAREGKPDVIVTDPPRAGMHEDVVKQLLEIEAEKIVYVSCNPATQARDLALLDEKYKVTKVQPVDMFPHTHHVENVVRLDLR